MRQSSNQSLLGQSDPQLSLQTSDDEFGFRARAGCEQLLNNTDLLRLRLAITLSISGTMCRPDFTHSVSGSLCDI